MARKLIELVEARITLALSIIILALVVAEPFARGWLADKTPPIARFHKTEALNSPTTSGGILAVRIWRDKVRDDCPVTSRRYAISDAGVTFDIPDGEWYGGPAGGEYFDFAYPLPAQMPPGDYELRVHLSYSCPNVDEPFDYDQPPTRFQVRD